MRRIKNEHIKRLYEEMEKTEDKSLKNALLDVLNLMDRSKKYYELQTTSNYHIFYSTFLSSDDLETIEWKNEIENLKAGEYASSFVHLKEITECEYRKYKEM